MRVTIRTNAQEFQRALQSVQQHASAGAARVVQALTEGVQRDARALAPVADGALYRGITRSFSARPVPTGVVTSGAPHAAFVEFGTGPLGSQSYLSALAHEAMRDLGYRHGSRGGFPPKDALLRWMRIRGIPEDMWFAIASSIRESGTRAQPHLLPATERARAQLLARHDAELRRALRAAS